jgi:ElaB/YqjD/DUF883 family membrane-anchored ribosome-binding protein
MTSTDPEVIRHQIEQTRSNLSANVNTLADTVNPVHAAKRKTARARIAMRRVKDRVMGTATAGPRYGPATYGTSSAGAWAGASAPPAAGSGGSGVRGAVSNVGNKVSDLGSTVGNTMSDVGSTVGNTMSDVGSTMSDVGSTVSNAVSEAPQVIRSQAQGNPLAAGLIAFGVGWLVGSLLPATEPEQQAAAKVKETAGPAVTGLAKETAGQLKEPAQQAVESVRETATDAAATVREEGKSGAQDVAGTAQDAKETVQAQRS